MVSIVTLSTCKHYKLGVAVYVYIPYEIGGTRVSLKTGKNCKRGKDTSKRHCHFRVKGRW